MPTILTHALLPLIGAAAVPKGYLSTRLIVAGMAVAMLPDADVVGRYFHVPHTHDFGHRGATHTLLFALLVGGLGMLAARSLRTTRAKAFLFLWLSTLSHALTDMLTEGGKGIMMFWPLEDSRLKFLLHPIEASPVGLTAFETGVIWQVLLSETRWLLIPAVLIAFFARLTVKTWRAPVRAD